MPRVPVLLLACVKRFWALFLHKDALHVPLLTIFVCMHGILLFNACYHEPSIGYDAHAYTQYIQVLAEWRLPTAAETHEFFSPPLPFFLPSTLVAVGATDVWWAMKWAQFFNIVLSIGLVSYLLKILHLISPHSPTGKTLGLGFLAMLPVYYKTFAFVRGEPYVAYFAVMATYYSACLFVKKDNSVRSIILLGVVLGLLALSRQWGFLVFPALILFVGVMIYHVSHDVLHERMALSKTLVASLCLSFVVGSWFYLSLYARHGTFTAFNAKAEKSFALSNQPVTFYFGFPAARVFGNPIRRSFPNQLLPIFYSDVWGDYWGYFLVYGKDRRNNTLLNGLALTKQILKYRAIPWWLETNRLSLAAYLGRVNLVSLLPSVLALISFGGGLLMLKRFVWNADQADHTALLSFVTLTIVTSLLGYLWFLIMYPSPIKGDTIKASYMLQIYPFFAVLVGYSLERLKQRAWGGYVVLLVCLGGVWLHNVSAFFTRYSF